MRRRRYSSYDGYGGYGRKKSRGGLYLFLLTMIIAGGAFIYVSPEFERVPPVIETPPKAYWNGSSPIWIEVSDNGGLGEYQVEVSDGKKSVVVASGRLDGEKRSRVSVSIPLSSGLDTSSGSWRLTVKVRDRSMWNFMRGNLAVSSMVIEPDLRPPMVGVVANSPSIVRGGSALVVFQAEDDHLKSVYISAGGRRFEVVPYRKKGFYASLVAWPFREKRFKADIVARDEAGNRRVVDIPFERITKRYKVSYIRASDRFIDGKIAQVADSDPEASRVKGRIERFKAVNEGMRERNEKLIHSLTKGVTPVDFDKWKIKAFYPLKSAKVVAYFGDERYYYYKNRKNVISHSWHLGYDLASTRQASIKSSNDGEVLFASYNGIYGNMPLIDHGFGLYTLYGHCSSVFVVKGEKVKAGEVIAKTGTSGLALGDHLHFGILVQGVEVWPMDWMKQNWIESHIQRVFRRADKAINR
jgi:murein DD-endopeptidase MepM/ murein hydrolase activator NlpD